jgi:hypothetical protein
MLKVIRVALLGLMLGALSLAGQTVRADSLSEGYLLPDLFDIMAKEGRSSSLSDPAVPETAPGRASWERAIARIYDAQRMHDDFLAALDGRLDAETRADALAFAQSDLGRRVLQLEVSARRALLSEEIDEAARMALVAARNASNDSAQGRALARVRERIAVNELIELNVSLGLNTSLAYYNGMAEAGWMAGLAGADMLALVWAQEGAIRSDVTDWAESYFLLAYQPLTEDEMADYISYAASPAGDSFNRAMFHAFDAVFVDISRRVGAAMAQQMQQDTL